VVVPFERDGSGEYRLSYDPRLASVFFDPLAIRERWDATDFGQPDVLPRGRSELSVMLDLGRMQEVPPQEQVLIERVETAESYQTRPVAVQVDRFVDPSHRGTLAVVTVDLADYDDVKAPAIIARFTPFDATQENRILGEGSFRLSGESGRRVAQGRVVLRPGAYTLTVIVADPLAAQTGMHRARIEIPDPAAKEPRFSDVVLAQRLEPLEYASLVSYEEPFIIGPYRVVPRLGRVFRPGDAVRLMYEVYGVRVPLHVAYRVEGQEADGSWVALGSPSEATRSTATQAWELSTAENWPAGAYRIAIEVTDADERRIARTVEFTLRAADAP